MVTVLCLVAFGQLQELSELRSELTGTPVPKGGTLTLNRKFMVLESRKTLPHGLGWVPAYTVVIGPLLGSYFHQTIMKDEVVPPLEPCGGGTIEFAGVERGGEVTWSAKFHGESGDYGVYTPALLEEEPRQAIADALGIDVEFEWREYSSPKK